MRVQREEEGVGVRMHDAGRATCAYCDVENDNLMIFMVAFASWRALGSTGSEQSTGISSGEITRRMLILAAIVPCGLQR